MLEAALATLDELIAFDTVSSRSNLALIDWAADKLAAAGATLSRTFDDTGEKVNLLATFGPDGPGGVVLSGHSDVVPTEGQPWSTDPFRLRREGDTLYGRGVADMKGFVAAAMATLCEAKPRPARPIHLAISYDEEVGCLGVPRLVDALVAEHTRPAYAIIGEPTLMRIVTAHKSCNVFETRFEGHAAHSSLSHRGISANVALAAFVTRLKERFDKMAVADPSSNLEPPYPTFNAGVVAGGTSLNIIPAEARLVWEFRAMPGQDAEAIAAEILFELSNDILPPLATEVGTPRARTTRLATVPPLDPATNRAPREALMDLGYAGDDGVGFGTEAGFFQAAGIPAVVCGPGTIEVAHQPDESLSVSELDAATKLIEKVIAEAQ